MPELMKSQNQVVNAVLNRKGKYVRVIDWEGKSFTFILADEIQDEEKPVFSALRAMGTKISRINPQKKFMDRT